MHCVEESMAIREYLVKYSSLENDLRAYAQTEDKNILDKVLNNKGLLKKSQNILDKLQRDVKILRSRCLCRRCGFFID